MSEDLATSTPQPQWQPTTITTLEAIWPLLEAPLQTALEPYKESAAWFEGPLPLWPPLGILVEDGDAQQAVMTALAEQRVSGILVVSRHDASTGGGLGLDAYHLPLEQLVAAYLAATQTAARVLNHTVELMERTKLNSMLTILWQLMASCRVQKPLATCSPTELDMVQADAQNAVATVLARMGQSGASAVQSQQPQEPRGPSVATAPLQLPTERAPDPAPVIEPRPFGFLQAAQARRDADRAWDLYWSQAPRYL